MSSRRLSTLALLITLSSCVSPPSPPPPAEVALPKPAPVPPVVPASSDWRDWPLTPGDWSYAPGQRGSIARFGRAGAAADLSLRCDRTTGQVTLARRLDPAAAASLTIRTSSTVRAITAQPTTDGQLAVTLPGSDPILDAMGFSRGRFVVQQSGGTTLVVPAWPEILRVAEDCRG